MKRRLYPQLGCGHLFIEERNTCPHKTRKIHNVLLRGGESKIKKSYF